MLALSSFRAVTTCILLCLLFLVAACGLHADVLFQEDFESGLGEWTIDNGVWQVGTPTAGPESAHGGANCATTGLTGNYSSGPSSRLISPEITLLATAGQEIWLRYWAWFNYPSYNYCYISVRVKGFDGNWGAWSNVDFIGSPYFMPQVSPWSLLGLDLTPHAGQTIQVGFYHDVSSAATPRVGMYVDDVTVVAEVPSFVAKQGFEGDWEGWTTENGIWQIGQPLYGPGSAYSGSQCIGTYLSWPAPPFPDVSASRLVSPTVRLPPVEAGQTLTIRLAEWWDWINPTPPEWGRGVVSVQDPVTHVWGDWSHLTWANAHAAGASGGWIQNSADLTSYAGEAVRFGFYLSYSWYSPAKGWYIDDVEIEVPLQAAFVGVPVAGAVPLPVQFTDASMGGPTAWSWDFGDSGTSALQNPSHVYAAPGSYTVSLTAGRDAETDVETKVDYIAVLPAMAADFSASQTSGSAPLPVTFTDLSVPAATNWSWSFGDGANSSFQNPTHIYSAPGVYTVSLTAHDAYSTDTETKAAYVTVAQPLMANFDGTPLQGTFPLAVSFTDASTGGPTSWLWSFGDGANSDQQNPSHEYGQPGTKTVTLSVSNDLATDSETKLRFVKATFIDVPFDSMAWAVNEVLACVDANVVKGYDGGLYQPHGKVTRDQMAVFVARALVQPSGDAGIADPTPPPTFADVGNGGPGDWAYKQIEYVASQGIVKGFEEETPSGTVFTYRPTLVVDRGQMAVYIARAMNTPTGDAAIADPVPPYHFVDVPGADSKWAWCLKYIEYLAEQGIVHGYLEGDTYLYHPEFLVTRDQMAVYVQRAFQLPM